MSPFGDLAIGRHILCDLCMIRDKSPGDGQLDARHSLLGFGSRMVQPLG